MNNMNDIINEMTYSLNKDLKSLDNGFNRDNLTDYSGKTSEDYRRNEDNIAIQEMLRTTDWEAESKYHNHYYVNGKVNMGRTITLKK